MTAEQERETSDRCVLALEVIAIPDVAVETVSEPHFARRGVDTLPCDATWVHELLGSGKTGHAAVPHGRSKMGQAQTRTSRDDRRIKTILLVEDHDDSRTMLRLLLESENYYVLEATTGPEALKIARLRNPDLILMDIGLPELDGVETIRRIRQIDWLQKTPIVVLSAYSGPAYYQSAMEAGGNYFVSKPIDFDKLKAVLIKIDSGGTFQQRHSEPDTGRAVKYTPDQRNDHRSV